MALTQGLLGWHDFYVRGQINFGAGLWMNPDCPLVVAHPIKTKGEFPSITEGELVLAAGRKADHASSFIMGSEVDSRYQQGRPWRKALGWSLLLGFQPYHPAVKAHWGSDTGSKTQLRIQKLIAGLHLNQFQFSVLDHGQVWPPSPQVIGGG